MGQTGSTCDTRNSNAQLRTDTLQAGGEFMKALAHEEVEYSNGPYKERQYGAPHTVCNFLISTVPVGLYGRSCTLFTEKFVT